MKFFSFILIGLFALQMPLSASEISIDKMLIDYNDRLNKLKIKNKALQGKIEVLEQQQHISTSKIKELFHLLKYQKNNSTIGKNMLRVEEGDKVAKKTYANAKSFLMIGEYDQAIEYFTNYPDLYPGNVHTADAHYWLAKSYLAKEDYHGAKKVFIEFQKENSLHYKFPNSLYEMAYIYAELNDHIKAELFVDTLIKKFPKHAVIPKAKALLKVFQKPLSPALVTPDVSSKPLVSTVPAVKTKKAVSVPALPAITTSVKITSMSEPKAVVKPIKDKVE